MTRKAEAEINAILSHRPLKGKKIIMVHYKSKVIRLTISPTVVLDENSGKLYEFPIDDHLTAREVVRELRKRVSFRV